MFCNHCGSEIKKDSHYCSQCGISLDSAKDVSFVGDINQYCKACGTPTAGNYCSACGGSCETVKTEIKKQTFTHLKQKAQMGKEQLNKDQMHKIVPLFQSLSGTIKEKLSDKKAIKAYGIASLVALMSTYILALGLFFLVKQIAFVKEGYQSFSEYGKVLPNFVDLAHFAWQSIFRGNLVIEGSDGFTVTILSSMHSIIFLLIPIFSVWAGQKVLRKKMTARIIDYGILSTLFTLVFHIIALFNHHSMNKDIFYNTTMEWSYGVFLLRNIVGVGVLFFVLSLVMDYKQVLLYKGNIRHEKLDQMKKPMLLGLKASFQVLILGSVVTFFAILIGSIILKVEFKAMLALIFIVWPNIALNGINMLLGGTAYFMGEGISNHLFSLFDMLKNYGYLMGDEPIFIMGIIGVIGLVIGVVAILIGQVIQLGENRQLKETAIYAGVVFLITQVIAFASQWFSTFKIHGDISMLGSDIGSIGFSIGFFNMKAFIGSALFIGIVVIGSSLLIKKFKQDTLLKNLYHAPRKKIAIYGIVMLLLIIIQIVIIKQYSYSGSDNILMGIIASKFSMLRDTFSDMFDILDYLYY